MMMTTKSCTYLFGERCKQFGYHDFLRDYKHHVVPEEINKETIMLHDFYTENFTRYDFYDVDYKMPNTLIHLDARRAAIELCGFSLVNKITTKELAKYIGNRKCIEIMAGTGAWSKALINEGVNIHPTDLKIDSAISYNNSWMDVEEIDCVEAIKKYNPDVVLCSWPRSDSPIDAATDEIFKNPIGELIYIGETWDGCCASNYYFESVEKFIKPLNIYLPRWEGIYDDIYSIKASNFVQ